MIDYNEAFKALIKAQYKVSDKAIDIVENARKKTDSIDERFEKIAQYNQTKVLCALREHKIGLRHFAPTTGYGYDDVGRDALDKVFAQVFGAEDAIVRPQIVSGTHAITTALFGLLKAGDEMLSITSTPYDTLQEAIGIKAGAYGSLKDYNISYNQVEFKDGKIDVNAAISSINDKTKVIYIQRSRGYAWRDSLSIDEIKQAVSEIKKRSTKELVFVCDNCYGEFTDIKEPTEVGVDVIIGSLIKNPGGGIAPTGAYIAGKNRYLKEIESRLTSPGIGKEVGSYAASYQPFFQGLFFAPHVVGQSLKGLALISCVMENLGFEVLPRYDSARNDIVQSILFSDEELLVKFCQSVQKASPIDSNVLPMPWEMPGYEDNVIMAAGTFVQGSSVELSADAPIRPPYIAYIQGGLTFEHIYSALIIAVDSLIS